MEDNKLTPRSGASRKSAHHLDKTDTIERYYSLSLSNTSSSVYSVENGLETPSVGGVPLGIHPETILEDLPNDPLLKAQIEADLAILAEDPPSEEDDQVEEAAEDEKEEEEEKNLAVDIANVTMSKVQIIDRSGFVETLGSEEPVRFSGGSSGDGTRSPGRSGSMPKASPPLLSKSLSKKRVSKMGSNEKNRVRKSVKKTKADFEFGELLGEGSYGRVYHSRLKATNKEFAVKVIDRRYVLKNDQKKYIMREKEALTIIQHPNLMSEHCKLYTKGLDFVLEYCEGGELMKQVRESGGCTLEQIRFYSAEIILALEYLHEHKIIHRDLKPENVLLRADGHIVVTDFGTVRLVEEEPSADQITGEIRDRKNSFVGSAEYVSPEILNGEPCGFASDLWSLGCLIYTLIEGKSPFKAGTEYLTFQKILHSEVSFTDNFPEVAKDLIRKLLVKIPGNRLGAPPKGISELKMHPFFSGIDFETINHTPAPVKFTAKVSDPLNKSSFLDKKDKHSEIGTGSRSHDANKKWRRFLRASEEIILAGFVQKRRGIFAKRRLLILSDYPRLVYIDAEKMEKKGEIPWSPTLFAELKNYKTFYVHTPARSYYIQSEDIRAKEWVEEINKPKKNYPKPTEKEDSKSTMSGQHPG